MKRMTYIVTALALVLGLAQCKKEEMPASNQVEGISITLDVNSGASSGSKVNVDPNGHHDPDYATVTFETGDTIFVGNNGQYCGFLIYNGSKFTGSIDDTNLSGSDYLHFYFLGGLGFRPTVDGNTATVNISNQTEKYPVISYAHSKEFFSSDRHSYKAKLQNKVSIMKFNVTTPSSLAICITGMNNKVNVDFTTPNGTDNGFSYEKQGTGEIKMKGQAGSGEKTYWAIVLPQGELTTTGDAYSEDHSYTGTRPTIHAIESNKYYHEGDDVINMAVNTLNPDGPLATPLTLEALTDGTIVVNNPKSGMQYSLNGGQKTAVSGDITVAKGNKVAFYGNGTNISNYYGTEIKGTAQVKVYGNIMSLVNEINYATATTVGSTAFRQLFRNNTTITDAKGLILPATTLEQNSYAYMFQYCTGLITPPEILATTLNNTSSCTGMFEGCTNLESVPELHITQLSNYCFQKMFKGCTRLTFVPANLLPATTLARGCYESMFEGCTSLTNVPNLPATTLSERCYNSMFKGCTSLPTVPANLLPATTLANAHESKGCYESMFQGCTNLTNAPALPAATLKDYCYKNMFKGCSNLNSVTCLATNISATDCTTDWLNGVAATGTFTKAASMSSWTTGADGIPSGWTVENAQ